MSEVKTAGQLNAKSLFDSDNSEKNILLIIVLVALAIRLFFLIYFESYIISIQGITVMDEFVGNGWAFGFESGRIAKAIATGEGFSSPFPYETGPTAWLMPLYPYLLAFIFRVFGVYTTNAAIATLTINCFASALTCIPLYYIGRMLFGRAVGYFSAGALALYPPSIWHAINTIWDTTVFTFLAMVLIYWLLLLPNRLNLKNATLYGFFMGVIALVNPVIIAFYPFIAIWLYFKTQIEKGRKAAYIGIACLLCFLTLMPWLLRNYVVFGHIMLRSNFGLEFKLGNGQEVWNGLKSDGTKNPPFWKMGHPSIDRSEFQRYVRFGEMGYVAQCCDEAMGFVKENPDKFLRLTLGRIWDFWFHYLSFENVTNFLTGDFDVSFSVSRLKKLFNILLLPFIVYGIWLSFRNKLNIFPLVAFVLFIPLVYYITHVLHRYRYPIEPVILLFSAYGFLSMIPRMKRFNAKVWIGAAK